MKPLTILVDLDGVVVDWSAQFDSDRAWYYPHIKFDALEEFTTPTNLPQHHQDAIDWVKHRPGFYSEMLPIEGAIDGVMALMASGHDVWFCSTPETRNPTCASDKIAWVTQYLGAKAAQRVILTHDKTLVRGDLLIDDRPDVKGAMKPTWKQVLFTQPYNAKVGMLGHNYCDRAFSWADVPGVVKAFALKRAILDSLASSLGRGGGDGKLLPGYFLHGSGTLLNGSI